MSMARNDQDEISGKKYARDAMVRLLPFLREDWRLFVFSLALVLTATFVALYSPVLLGRIIDEALKSKNKSALFVLVGLYAGLELARIAATLTQSLLLQRVGQRVMHRLRGTLYGRLLRMPVSFFDKNPVGRLVTRITNDTSNLSELFGAGFISFFSDILLIFGVLTAMVYVHPTLGMLSVAVFPLMLAFMVYFSRRLQVAYRLSRRALAIANGYFSERVSGMPLVQLMSRQQYEADRYTKLSLEYRDLQFGTVYLYSLFHPAITLLSGISTVAVIYFGAVFVNDGSIAIGTFVTFLAYVQTLYQPVRSVTDKYNIYLAAMASAERIFSLLDMAEEEGLRSPVERSSAPLRGKLAFNGVCFKYGENSSLALDHLSFQLNPGERLAIVGSTGAGKSTLVSLLFRFYEPLSGEITLDDRPLSSFHKQDLRRRVGFVQQEVFLFTGTVRENLRLLARDATDADILRVSKLTGFWEILDRLPQGLDTILDERGANLSLGERQILALTRVLIQDPEILVLDEATASVDYESAKKIQLASENLMRGRSALIIAHRLETVKNADKILVLESGRLREFGSHDELKKQKGVYSKLLALQDLGAQIL